MPIAEKIVALVLFLFAAICTIPVIWGIVQSEKQTEQLLEEVRNKLQKLRCPPFNLQEYHGGAMTG